MNQFESPEHTTTLHIVIQVPEPTANVTKVQWKCVVFAVVVVFALITWHRFAGGNSAAVRSDRKSRHVEAPPPDSGTNFFLAAAVTSDLGVIEGQTGGDGAH